MWRETLQRHCSDETLLAHADGELSPLGRWIVVRHLNKCWQCRARLEELDGQALALARVLDEMPYLGPEHMAEARARLLFGQDELEREHSHRLTFLPSRNPFHPRSLVTAGTAFALVVLGFWIYFAQSGRMREPKEVLAQVTEREQATVNTPLAVHQTMRVEITELAPRRTSLATGRLEIWTQTSQGPFALRWLNDEGAVRHAVWRGPDDRTQVYSVASIQSTPARSQHMPAVQSTADLFAYGLDPTTLEAAFMRWLEHWQGRPVSLSSDFAAFAGRGGVVLTVKRMRSADGVPLLRFLAVRAVAGGHIKIVMEVDATTWKPRLQCVRFETAEKSVEFRLAMETQQFVPYSSVTSEVSMSREWFGRTTLPASPEAPEIARHPDPPVLSPAEDLDGLDIQVRYALHRIRACLGEPVEIIRDPSGRILVQGLVKNVERRRELLTTLGELGHPAVLSVDIKAMSEVSGHETEASDVSGSLTKVTAGRLPVEEQLKSYFRERLPADDGSVAHHVTRFTNDAVSGADAALGEAWALRRLIERYPAEKCRQMDRSQQWLLEVMLRDHLTALRVRMSDAQKLVEPVLLRLAQLPAGEVVEVPEMKEEVAEPVSEHFALRTFEAARHIDELLLALFSSGHELPAETRGAEVEGIALDLLRSFRRLEKEFVSFDVEVSRSYWESDQADSRGYKPER
ncbi:MAG: hypothetical protein ABFD60_02195 [Bryobacteraceae bacterium]